uniref:Putative conserved secreted protein n=2 Tax=Nyssomyia neivai TaxID=330878 RepID=A0A1L8DNL4_9DIPT
MGYVAKFVVVLSLIFAVLGEEEKQPSGIKYEKFVVSPGSEKYLTYKMDAKQLNDTAFQMACEIEQLQDMDNTWETSMAMYHSPKNDGKYEEIFKLPKEKICDYMKGELYKDHIYPEFKELSNIPEPGTCPVPKGVYKIAEHVINVDDAKGLGKIGGWRMDTTFFKDGELVSENQLFFTVF